MVHKLWSKWILLVLNVDSNGRFLSHPWLLESMASNLPVLLISVLNFLLTHLQMKDEMNKKLRIRIEQKSVFKSSDMTKSGSNEGAVVVRRLSSLCVQKISQQKGPASRNEPRSQSYKTKLIFERHKLFSVFAHVVNFNKMIHIEMISYTDRFCYL
jgi:hypothetical protein